MTWLAFVQHALGELIVLGAEGLREAGNALGRRLPGLLAQKIGDLVIVAWAAA